MREGGSSQELERSRIDRIGDRWEAGWSGGGRDEFALCCTVDIRYEDPLTAEPIEGVDALLRHAERLRRAIPDLRVERAGARIAEGRNACFPWRIVGTQTGSLGEIPPTDHFLTMHGIHYVELRDDLICRARGFFDVHDAAVQLGVLPKSGSLAQSALLMLRGFGLRVRS
jgi:predicted ester cyclase